MVVSIVFASALFPSSCVTNDNANNNTKPSNDLRINENSNSAKTNVEELGLLINIPYDAEDIAWKIDDNRTRLIAVFRFSPTDAAKLVEEVERLGQPLSVKIALETWYPAELIAQGTISGDDTLEGQQFNADPFLNETNSNGTITRIQTTEFFILDVSQ
jgi:hypothetical protein